MKTAYNCKIGHALPSSPRNLCSDSNIQYLIQAHPDLKLYKELYGDAEHFPCDSNCKYFSNQISVSKWRGRAGFD
jgi:hypothetical protein